MNVKEILVRWLKSHGYDGLYTDECGCSLNELILCTEDPSQCKPGVKKDQHRMGYIGPREEPDPVAICKNLECKGGLKDCPGNQQCPAVLFSQENPVDCAAVAAYMKQQIELSRRCSYCHGENSVECDHCGGTGKEQDKKLD